MEKNNETIILETFENEPMRTCNVCNESKPVKTYIKYSKRCRKCINFLDTANRRIRQRNRYYRNKYDENKILEKISKCKSTVNDLEILFSLKISDDDKKEEL